MLIDITRFEIRYQLKSPVFVAVFLIFFLLTFGAVTIDEIQIGSTSAVNINSPHAIIQTILVWTLFGMFIPTAFLVSGILRDSSFNTQELFYTSPVRERDYLIGRFIGGAIATVLAFASVPLAIMLGSVMPWLDPDLVGPFALGHYAYGMFVFGVPNLMIAGMVMFSVANLTRSNMLTYVALVFLLIIYFVASEALQNPQYRNVMALADPFGFNTYAEATRYYTAAERNTLLPPLQGHLLGNRLIWVGVAVALFAFNVAIFRFRKAGLKRFGRAGAAAVSPTAEIEHIVLPRIAPSFSRRAALTLFGSRVWFEIKGVVFNVAFWVLLALGIFNTLGALIFSVSAYGTPNYPVTRIMVDLIAGAFSLVPLIVIIFYSSEVIWRERGLRFNEVIDATPAPSWVFLFSKYIAMLCVLAGLFLVVMLTTMLVQLTRGYSEFEVGQYIQRLVVDIGLPLAFIAVLAIFFQVLTNNRWLGMLAVMIVFIGSLVFDSIGLEHNLYDFGGSPWSPYSDMNGYGHFLAISIWFYLYWGAISVILLILSYLLWNRGTLTPIVTRLRRLGGSFGPATAIVGLLSVATAVSVGGWIYHNTVIVNDYIPGPAAERRAAAFERGWGERLLDVPQPKITDVSIDVDIYPKTRRYEARGQYTLENKTDAPISRVWLSYGEAAIIDQHAIDNASLSEFDADFGIYGFDFETAMQPGERRDLQFVVRVENPGFRNSDNVSTVNYNGTFFNNYEAMPSIGISPTAFLQDPQARRRQGLEPIQRAYALEDERRWREHYLRNDSDFVSFKTIVSTSRDQIAVAPGYLEREWVEGDRQYFEYVMDTPILNFYSWLSARYAVAERDWNGTLLQVFYHPPHNWNIERMLEASEDSLSYFSDAFSPFQYRQFRIFEFPAYQSFAQSFPNSIPYSEDIGFIADLRNPDDLDYVYYVTAHEAAHQWWAHQVMAANVQGGTMLIETLAQYGALMVMKQEYGEDAMRRFLKYELDNYLSSRGSEALEELPLYKVENQAYIHYRKGAVIMYALQDYIGEDVVNRTLSRLIDLRGFQGDPYATTLDFLDLLREEAGPEWDDLITDFFERIIIFDLKATGATKRALGNNLWEVTLDVDAAKFVADGAGIQTEEPIDYMVDIGIFTRDLEGSISGSDHVLFMEKRRVNADQMQFVISVEGEPVWAGIDPYNKLIDRNADDNLTPVSLTN